MEFLKAFFGDKAITYDELVQAINAYNGDEKNKEKLIKMVNLTDGGYVSKDKYTNLETDLSGKTTELTKANNLIEELKKSAGKDEETQQKITAYETEIADLKKENAELKTENALKFALVAAGAVDVDYLVFKARQIWKPSICYRLWRKKNVWQHPKNRKSYPVMLAGVVSHRHLRKITAAGRMSIWS